MPAHDAALALHLPVTLWHCLVSLLPASGHPLPGPQETINVAWLGPRVELDTLAVFTELAVLLPQQHLNIHMIGPDVPQQLHGTACKLRAGADQQQQHTTIKTTDGGEDFASVECARCSVHVAGLFTDSRATEQTFDVCMPV
eukprot:gene10850-11004_t